MMRTSLEKTLLTAALVVLSSCQVRQQGPDTDEIFRISGEHMRNMIREIGDTNLHPRSVNADGSLYLVSPGDWTSGFYPGCLWFQYEYSGEDFWKTEAGRLTRHLEDQKFNGGTHDMGFKMYCSAGNGYRLTGDNYYRDVLLRSAETLITRFNPAVGCIRSWDHHRDKWQFPVIIDNMMNLELLCWAFHETGDSNYYRIAFSHAATTLKNHFRGDNSSIHVVDYDTLTGNVIARNTHQGASDESAWARGQAWGLYGFTMMYRETGYRPFLDQAIRIADFIMNHENLPEDGVPYWDYNAPEIPDAPRDASAAAIACSALYELCRYLGDEGEKYRSFADKIHSSLSSPAYLAEPGTNHNFILKHSTGNRPSGGEVDVPIVYADYYFLEATLRKGRNSGSPGSD
jgi:unsaturated chondroitin disaccharide hydrolase